MKRYEKCQHLRRLPRTYMRGGAYWEGICKGFVDKIIALYQLPCTVSDLTNLTSGLCSFKFHTLSSIKITDKTLNDIKLIRVKYTWLFVVIFVSSSGRGGVVLWFEFPLLKERGCFVIVISFSHGCTPLGAPRRSALAKWGGISALQRTYCHFCNFSFNFAFCNNTK